MSSTRSRWHAQACRISLLAFLLVLPLLFMRPLAASGGSYYCPCSFHPGPGALTGGDPVELMYGAMEWSQTDLVVGGPVPMHVGRHHRTLDFSPGPLGTGTSLDYDYFVVGVNGAYTLDLVGPKNRRAQFGLHQAYGQPAYYLDTIDPEYAGAKLTIDSSTSVRTLRFPDGSTMQFESGGALFAIRDNQGNGLDFGRNASGYLTSIANTANSQTITLTYGANGMLASATDVANNRTVSYAYDANGRLSTVTDPNNGVTTYTWTDVGYGGSYTSAGLVSVTDPRNVQILHNTYDTSGRVATQYLGNQGTFQYVYLAQPDGTQITQVTDPDNNTTSYHLAGIGYKSYHVLDVTDPRGRTTTYTYASSGLPFLTGITDFRNRTVSFDWDPAGHLLAVHRPTLSGGTATTSYTWDGTFDVVTSVTDELNQTTLVTLNTQGLPASITPPVGSAAQFTYNTAGQVVTYTSPGGGTWTTHYRTDGRPDTVTDALNRVTTLNYDANGRPTGVTDALLRSASFSFNGMGRLTGVAAPGGSGYTVTRNPANMPTVLDVAGGAHHTWTYDNEGNVLSGTDPANATETVTRNPNGLPLVRTDRLGQRTEYTWSLDDRLQQEVYKRANGTVESTVTYSYDPNTDLLTSISDTAGPGYSFTYNALDEVQTVTGPEGTTTYGYDDLGRLTSVQLPGQSAETYGYDAYGRLSTVTQGTATLTYAYDPANRVGEVVRPNGVVTDYFRDLLGRVRRVEHRLSGTLLEYEELTWDEVGRVTSRERNGTVSTYGYDGLDRLNSYAMPGQSGTCVYDLAGNRTSQTVNGVGSTLAYATNGTNRLTQAGGASLTHDANGSVTQYGTATLTWDVRGRLVQVVDGGTTSTYTYDCLNRRTAKTVNGVTTRYVYLGSDLALEADASWNLLARYFYEPGVDHPVSRTDSSGTYYYLTDLSGNVAALTNASGTLLGTYQYNPWGQVVSSTSGLPTQPLRWGSRELDETGLYYLRGRYYDAGTGRFISEDPGGLGASLNLYTFALNRPVGVVDPFGACASGYGDDDDPFDDALRLIGRMFGAYGKGFGEIHEGAKVYGALPGAGPVINGNDAYGKARSGNYGGALLSAGAALLGAHGDANFVGEGTGSAFSTGASGGGLGRGGGGGGASDLHGVKEIQIPRDRYPESADHIAEAIANGHPAELTIDRAGAAARRKESLKGIPTVPGMDRDEFPGAVFKEGGSGSSVKHIPSGDNRGSGAYTGNEIRDLPDGSKVRFIP